MKKLTVLVLTLVVCFACNNDDDRVDCGLAIPEPRKNLFIDLVDVEGNNLIENGTFNPEEIMVRFGNTISIGPVFTEIPQVQNFIAITVFGEEGDNRFEIVLNETETDVLVLNLTVMEGEGPCSIDTFTINDVTYNGVTQTLQEFNEDFLITAVRK